MKHRTKFFSAVILVVGSLAATTGGCELISSVDRTKIPGGSGGGEAGGGGSTPSSSSTTLPVTTSITTTTTSTTSNGGGGNSTTSNGGGGSSTTSNGGGGSTANGGGGSTANGGGGSTGTSGGGGSGGCSSAADCQKPNVDCKVATCKNSVCGVGDAADDVMCSAGVCLSGDCVGCISDADCTVAPDLNCNTTSHACTTNGCTDTHKDGLETDIDCGGTVCPGCGVGKKCVLDTDCIGGVLGDGSCSGSPKTCQATCNDGVQDNGETDTDCGGGTCPKCDVGFKCMADSDCKSTGSGVPGFCNTTTKKCIAPTCTDLFQNGKETDLNCGGGTCPGCDIGQNCGMDGDCKSGSCVTGKCAVPAHCSNGTLDGDETDADCGGSCAPCGFFGQCLVDADCGSMLKCLAFGATLRCLNATCANGNLDSPSETDTDCGNFCPHCATGKACVTGTDCASGVCDGTSHCT